MANEKMGLMGYKLGMTQVYGENGTVIPVTVVDVSGNTVLKVKTAESADGYNALQLGLGERKEKHTTRANIGVFNKIGVTPKRYVREIRVSEADVSKYTDSVGSVIAAGDVFSEGLKVDITGTSKGRGFAGVMKRHNFAGFIRSHGTHEFFRHGGSIGTRLTPGHVLKGKKMPGHMGAARVTVQNLSVVKVDAERNLLFIKGGIPGPNKGLVVVRRAVKIEQ